MRARDNPFAVHRVLAVRYRFIDGGWNELFARLDTLGSRGAIVGPEGSGKTTLLEDLERELAGRGRKVSLLSIGADQSRLTPLQTPLLLEPAASKSFLLVDGADALGGRALRSLLRKSRSAAGLVVTSHREGLLPTLWRTRTSPDLLASTVRELTDRAPEAFGWSADSLWERHAGNLRGALRELYDRCADLN